LCSEARVFEKIFPGVTLWLLELSLQEKIGSMASCVEGGIVLWACDLLDKEFQTFACRTSGVCWMVYAAAGYKLYYMQQVTRFEPFIFLAVYIANRDTSSIGVSIYVF